MKHLIKLGIGLVVVALPLLLLLYQPAESLTGFVTADTTGCCEFICQQTSAKECPTTFHAGKACGDVGACNIGCCIDPDGYCLSNYLENKCTAGTFLSSGECLQHPLCISTPPPGSLRGATGYPFVFTATDKGIVILDQVGGNVGDPLAVKVNVFGNETNVDARIFTDAYNELLHLYDDGNHGDGNLGDGLFAAIWDTKNFGLGGIAKVNVAPVINGAESKISDYFLISPYKCVPIRKQWEAHRRDFIFAMTGPPGILKNNALGIIGQLGFNQNITEQLNSQNFYVLPQQVNDPSEVVNACIFFDPLQDFIIFFDKNIEKCEQRAGFVRMNPLFIMDQRVISESNDIDTVFKDFCKHVITQKQLVDQVIDMLTAPNITFLSPRNNSIFTSSEIFFTFMVNDTKDKQLPYSVYIDINNPLTLVKEGVAFSGQLVNFSINITDGSHDIWVESEDSDGNLGHSDVHIVSVNESNFVIDILSLDPLQYNFSPEINFTISHVRDFEVNYTLVIDDSTTLKGSTLVNNVTRIKTKLSDGNHVISIIAHDFAGRFAYSLPYEIYVGNETEE